MEISTPETTQQEETNATATNDPATIDAAVTGEAAKPPTAAGPIDVNKTELLVIDALHSVFDPEIPVDIYDLGLIYNIDVQPTGKISITMTLTTPACPVAGSMPGTVEKTVRLIDGVTDVVVDLVWDPVWSPAMMTESARLQLNMY